MNESTLIWLFGISGAWCLFLTGVWVYTRNEVKRIRLAVELFVDGIGKGAAMVLHSPDDHLGFDDWCDLYLERHYEMTFEEWESMQAACLGIISNPNATKLERGQARMLSAVCEHKLVMKPYPKK